MHVVETTEDLSAYDHPGGRLLCQYQLVLRKGRLANEREATLLPILAFLNIHGLD